MIDLNIYCDEYDFSPLAAAFEGEAEADCPLGLEIIFADREDVSGNSDYDTEDDEWSFFDLFKMDLCDEDGKLFLGSIVICTEVAKAQAEEYGHSYERELFYLAAHGVCHLLGYDHMTDADKAEMREKEERVMKKMNLTREE